ncbi:MAG: PorV/PorQ family protein [Ignavibacteria bacterium]|nr:MAG: PorV/PorQ family protein [Ignavibacteria bacterium]
MNMLRSLPVFGILAVMTPPALMSQEFNKSGRTAFQFLKIGVGARQAALGEASIATARDINSVFWDPAGLSGITTAEASFSYARWFAGMNFAAGAVGFRWNDIGTVGLSYASLNYGQIQEALVTVPSGSSDTRTGNTVTGGDLMLGLSFSRQFTEMLSIGATVKYLQEKLFVYRARILAYDVGTSYKVGYKGMYIAMSAQNFGPSVKFLDQSDREEGYDIPLVFRIGMSANLMGADDAFIQTGAVHRIVLSVDAIHTNDFGDRLHVGGEYWWGDVLALRAGYRFNYDEGNLSLGFGVKQNFSGSDLRLDYAYVRYQYLDSPHRLTLSLAF